jgi:hypothetical protein
MTCPKRAAPVAQKFHFPALRQAGVLRAHRAPQVLGDTPGGGLKQLGDPADLFSDRRPETR